jgi:hypothetical protein
VHHFHRHGRACPGDAFAALAGLEKGVSWSGLLVKTFQLQQAAIVGVMPRQSAGQRFPAKS